MIEPRSLMLETELTAYSLRETLLIYHFRDLSNNLVGVLRGKREKKNKLNANVASIDFQLLEVKPITRY